MRYVGDFPGGRGGGSGGKIPGGQDAVAWWVGVVSWMTSCGWGLGVWAYEGGEEFHSSLYRYKDSCDKLGEFLVIR